MSQTLSLLLLICIITLITFILGAITRPTILERQTSDEEQMKVMNKYNQKSKHKQRK